jgi:hypothetical protein
MPTGKCKLCLQTKELQCSHLLPSSLYKKSRWENSRNPNPALLSGRGVVQTSNQIRDYVLCRDCEQLFSRNGECYTMSQVEHRGTFPLLNTLRAVAPTKVNAVFSWYDRKAVPRIDRDKLGYFASSVFWRASAHKWKDARTNVRLGACEERFRQYLLGQEPFPRNAVLMLVACTDAMAQNTFYLPSLGLKNEITMYTMQIRGLNFMMMIGESMTNAMRSLCCVTGADGWIVARSCRDKIVEAAQRIAAGRTASL